MNQKNRTPWQKRVLGTKALFLITWYCGVYSMKDSIKQLYAFIIFLIPRWLGKQWALVNKEKYAITKKEKLNGVITELLMGLTTNQEGAKQFYLERALKRLCGEKWTKGAQIRFKWESVEGPKC